MKKNRPLKLVFLTLLLLFSFASKAFAETTLGVNPVKLEYTLKPGEKVTRNISVFNPGTAAIKVTSEISDLKIDNRGIPSFEDPKKNADSAANWLEINPREFNLAPGGKTEVQVTMQVPQNAGPGGHYGAVLFSFGGGKPGEVGLGVSGRIAVANIVLIPGEVNKNSFLSSFTIPFINSSYPIPMELSIQNKGNVHIPVDGVIQVDNWLGQGVRSIDIPEGYVFPDSTKPLKLAMDSGNIVGFYKATIVFNDKSIVNSFRPKYFVVFPWPLALGILLASYGIYQLGSFKGRRKADVPPDNKQ